MIGMQFSRGMTGFLDIYSDSSTSLLFKGLSFGSLWNIITIHSIISAS